MLNRRHHLTLLAAAALAAGGAQAQSDTVKIGVILPMTGQQASTGRQIDAAIKLWMAQSGGKAGGKPDKAQGSHEQLDKAAESAELAKAVKDNHGGWSIGIPGVDYQRFIVNQWDGLQRRAGAGTRLLYAQGTDLKGSSRAGFAQALAVARQADVVVMSMGEGEDMSGEARSRAHIGLPPHAYVTHRRVARAQSGWPPCVRNPRRCATAAATAAPSPRGGGEGRE